MASHTTPAVGEFRQLAVWAQQDPARLDQVRSWRIKYCNVRHLPVWRCKLLLCINAGCRMQMPVQAT